MAWLIGCCGAAACAAALGGVDLAFCNRTRLDDAPTLFPPLSDPLVNPPNDPPGTANVGAAGAAGGAGCGAVAADAKANADAACAAAAVNDAAAAAGCCGCGCVCLDALSCVVVVLGLLLCRGGSDEPADAAPASPLPLVDVLVGPPVPNTNEAVAPNAAPNGVAAAGCGGGIALKTSGGCAAVCVLVVLVSLPWTVSFVGDDVPLPVAAPVAALLTPPPNTLAAAAAGAGAAKVKSADGAARAGCCCAGCAGCGGCGGGAKWMGEGPKWLVDDCCDDVDIGVLPHAA